MSLSSNYIYVVVLAVSLIIIGLCVHFLKGGFDDIAIYELEGERKVVVGKQFSGKVNNSQITAHFQSAQQLILDSAILGTLVRINRPSDTLESGEVDFFIGILLDKEMAEIPIDYEVLRFEPVKRFVIYLQMNKWFRPSSSRVDDLLSTKALDSGFEEPPIIVELYYVDDSMSVEAWIL